MIKRLIRILRNPFRTMSAIHRRGIIRRINKRNAKINKLWTNQDFILANVQAAQSWPVSKYEGLQEAEHQIKRFRNIKNVVREALEINVSGDIIEFGTWQGMGLLLFNLALEHDQLSRKLVGVDSFEGLPENSNGWKKGDLSNTSLETAHKNINKRIRRDQEFKLIQGWFDDEKTINKIYSEVSKVAIVHFDADLGSSTATALKIMEKYLIERKEPIYFLFDDWGCHPDEVPEAFYSWLEQSTIAFKVHAEKLSSTRFTRYYRLTFKQ